MSPLGAAVFPGVSLPFTLAASPTANHLPKFAVFAFDCIRDNDSAYFNDVCTSLADIRGCFSLRAADHGDFLVPSANLKIDGRRFHITASTPSMECTAPAHQTLSERQFRSRLITR